jgi:vacuolar-type H+-ATPase subunit I/STV1
MVHGSLSLVFIQIFAGSGEGWVDVLPGMILGAPIVIGLELLVSFLQSLRLCWVEFFGKLGYLGTGRKFIPFKESRRFTAITG